MSVVVGRLSSFGDYLHLEGHKKMSVVERLSLSQMAFIRGSTVFCFKDI